MEVRRPKATSDESRGDNALIVLFAVLAVGFLCFFGMALYTDIDTLWALLISFVGIPAVSGILWECTDQDDAYSEPWKNRMHFDGVIDRRMVKNGVSYTSDDECLGFLPVHAYTHGVRVMYVMKQRDTGEIYLNITDRVTLEYAGQTNWIIQTQWDSPSNIPDCIKTFSPDLWDEVEHHFPVEEELEEVHEEQMQMAFA